MKLTQDQILAKRRIMAFIADKGIKEKYFTLSGKGGTGKTFVIGKALEAIVKQHADIHPDNIICATISHSAKNVLQESIGDKYNVTTIASLLNMQIDYEDDGEIKFVPPKDSSKSPISHPNLKIIVIDECSMVTRELFNLIMSMKNNKTKVIAMGDHCQLPPVGDEHGSPFLQHIGSNLSVDIFDENDDKIKLYDELTEILRYKGPVIELGEKIRDQVEICMRDEVYDKHIINKYTQRIDNVEDGSGYKFFNNPTTFIQIAAADFARNITNPMHCVVVAYTNKTVNAFNTLIRRQLYGNNLPKFVEGELIINSGGYNFGKSRYSKERKSQKIYNGEVFRVKNIYYEDFGPDNISSIVLTLHNAEYRDTIYLVNPAKGLKMYYARLNELKQWALKDKKQWSTYYAFKNQFAHFDYAYSRTTHKCQGQTLNNVYIHEEEIMNHPRLTIKEKFQSLYVAITRARNIAHIFNKQYRINN